MSNYPFYADDETKCGEHFNDETCKKCGHSPVSGYPKAYTHRHHDECPRCHSYKRVWGVTPGDDKVSFHEGPDLHSSEIISTTNEWRYYCRQCDIRFNGDGLILLRTTRQTYEICKEATLKTEAV